MPTKDFQFQKLIEGVLYDLMVRTNIKNVLMDDGVTTLSNALAGYLTGEQVNTRIEEVIGTAPAALDTLKELADALNNDPNFATTITTALSNKVDKVSGKNLSTEDFTTALKSKLESLKTTLSKSDVGLGNVDNTSDVNKPVSTAQQTELNKKVDKVAGKDLSTNDFTNEHKTKLESAGRFLFGTGAPPADLTETDLYGKILN